MTIPPFIDRLSEIADRYDLLLCDVWGVVHNGIAAHAPAVDALQRFRARNGRVVLITNAPRPNDAVARQIAGFGVPADTYDAIVSSGDVTRSEVVARPGQSVFHLGPARDRGVFDNLDLRFASADSADYVVCTGLFDDDTETPDDYTGMLAQMRARDLVMICANPDVVVERGGELVYCAGALADRYAALGGQVVNAGKPYAPIYEAAVAAAPPPAGGGTFDRRRMLAIGDSIRTDLRGAAAFGVDGLFIINGIHAEELSGEDRPASLARLMQAAGVTPAAVAERLAW